MAQAPTKIKPFHIVLIVLMSALTIALYLFKDEIIPNQNASSVELYRTFQQAEGTIVSSEQTGGRSSATVYTIQFRDQDDNLVTVTERNWQTMPLKQGEKVIMYYNPEKPSQAVPEKRWKEIMRQ